jgi:hypothetical protein
MDKETQRIAIAEACGWSEIRMCPKYNIYIAWHPDHGGNPLPDYLNDLNAMHEAEKVLSHNQGSDYYDVLCEISTYKAHMATAAQRAEAFLKTLNLWEG